MSEHSGLQRSILDYLNWMPGTYAFPTHDARHRPVDPGVADIICCRNGKTYAIEIKVGKDKMRKEQDDFGRRIVEAGGVHAVVEDLADAIAVFQQRRT